MMDLSNKLLKKPVCMFFLIVGLVFGNGIMFCFGNDPFSPLGTLSILCEDRKYIYWIWALFVVGGYLLNTLYAYRRYEEKSRFLRVLCIVAVLAACGVGLTLKHDVFSWGPKRIVHWICTGLYIGLLGLSLFLFLVKNAKKYRGFPLLAAMVVLCALIVVVWLTVLGKSGMMEMVPNTLLEILLFLLNFVLPVRLRGGAAQQ